MFSLPLLIIYNNIKCLFQSNWFVVSSYIDPGTGAMLFAILTGLIGVIRFAIKGGWLKFKVLISGGKKGIQKDDIPLVIFSEDKRYWPVFEPVCRMLSEKEFDVNYFTSSEDDPALKSNLKHFRSEFIGKGNKPFAKMNFLKATMVLSTTPGLDVYQWTRSKDVKYYIHIPHAPSELTTYRMFGLDYYDALLLSGEYQIKDCRDLEKLRNLPSKECVIVGIPYLDELANRINAAKKDAHERTILLAPSWGPNSLFNRFGDRLIDLLIETGYKLIIRPHPQSFTSEKDMIEKLMTKYNEIEWNRDVDNFDVLNRSDLMISDFSGVIFDFSLAFDKPVIIANNQFDLSALDAWWLDRPTWTQSVIDRIGPKLTPENISSIKDLIDNTLEDSSFSAFRDEIRQETWQYQGEGARRVANYIVAKYDELIRSDEKSEELKK